jgi:glyoxalase-like protein
VDLDHVFILCDEGAPEAEALLRAGLHEGSANTHPGQGTACRRFFFANGYLELLWVHDVEEARSERVRPTRLLDRWSMRHGGACPFGIALRPAIEDVYIAPPFRTWRYAPAYLPEGMAIEVAEDVPLAEPAIFYLGFQRGRARSATEPIDHAPPLTTIARATIAGPMPELPSDAARAVEATGQVAFARAVDYAVTLTFSGAAEVTADLRPELPLVLRW